MPDGATLATKLSVVDEGQRTTREVALVWKERRVLVDVAKHDVMLDFAWKELLRICLQIDPAPQYVVLTNQRDLHLYDLGRDREKPRISIALDDLPKHSGAFPFLSANWVPGTLPKIVDDLKVTREVAELVGHLYQSLKEQHPKREREVVQFVLQCILAMFAEDMGLLPHEHFTNLLYEGARYKDVERRIGDLFGLMNTRDVPGRVVPYFNGGLFAKPVTLPLGDRQLAALIRASEANWKHVDPHIFGSVFQSIMGDAERHKRGAHYTAHDDIMRVVGPTIVEPWRQRIRAAKTLEELLEARAALLKFRVLDPACGSGNFLYVAFREMYTLDTELLARMRREFPSTQRHAKARGIWATGIPTSNFFGIDINQFAVELAKLTLNIAKKIAFEERRKSVAELGEQLELAIDPSLPLDNLDKSIVRADALFAVWPEVDAIVGNPPIMGDKKIRGELGADYLRRLQEESGVDGVVDLSCYWFRRAHDRLPVGARAGLVGTSGIRVGKAREAALDYIVERGGTITNAVSSREWPGEAALNVSMVNWTKASERGPHQLIVDDQVFSIDTIATHLQLHADVSGAATIGANDIRYVTTGVQFGHDAFVLAETSELTSAEWRAKPFIRPVASGTRLLTGAMVTRPEFCVFLCGYDTEAQAKAAAGRAFEHLKKTVLPTIEKGAASSKAEHISWLRSWWRPIREHEDFFAVIPRKARRFIVCSNPQARPIFEFVSVRFVPTNTMEMFAFDDDYSFGVIQSTLHWEWTKAKGGKVRADIRYTAKVWTTFPWPQEPSECEVVAVAEAARALRRVRDLLMKENGWSLRALHQAAEIAGPHPLKDAQSALDSAVRAAYGMPEGHEVTEFLLELNKLVAEDEAEGRKVQGPGLPSGFAPRDPRWTSDDCIEPPRS
jgi:SAM-dependent methyltransferase